MIDHITFGVSDYERSTEFYDKIFLPLGVTRLFEVPLEHSGDVKVAGYGDTRPWFWIAEENPTSGVLHIAFRSQSRGAVDLFYQEALGAGGKDNGRPGLRPHYGDDYYAAFVLDPDGHNIEAVCRGKDPTLRDV